MTNVATGGTMNLKGFGRHVQHHVAQGCDALARKIAAIGTPIEAARAIALRVYIAEATHYLAHLEANLDGESLFVFETVSIDRANASESCAILDCLICRPLPDRADCRAAVETVEAARVALVALSPPDGASSGATVDLAKIDEAAAAYDEATERLRALVKLARLDDRAARRAAP